MPKLVSTYSWVTKDKDETEVNWRVIGGHNAMYVRKAQTLAIRVVDGQPQGSIDLL